MANCQPLLVIAPYALRDWSSRPRRYLDPAPLPDCAQALIGATFENDEQLERHYHQRQSGTVQRLCAASFLILRHRAALQSARMIYCLDGMHFALLLMLARTGLFRAAGKSIRRFAFHDSGIKKLATSLRRAPAGFQIECITHEQVASATESLGAQRIVYRPWKIDTDWFLPASAAPHNRALLPGNISRDESLVAPLLQRGFSLTRIARSDALRQRFATELANLRFSLVTNASHRDYLAHLHAANVVLLPIVACDGSAGLTAAMEAIAAGIPILANRSMGLTELFAECRYPVPMLENLDPAAWEHAWQQLEQQRHSSAFTAALAASRAHLLQHHSILPAGEDWTQIYRAALTAS